MQNGRRSSPANVDHFTSSTLYMRRTICTFCPEKKCLALEVLGRSGNRQIPLNELAMRALTKRGLNDVLQRGGRAMQNCVFSKDGSPLTPKMVHYSIDRYAKIMGVNATPSILRHTF